MRNIRRTYAEFTTRLRRNRMKYMKYNGPATRTDTKTNNRLMQHALVDRHHTCNICRTYAESTTILHQSRREYMNIKGPVTETCIQAQQIRHTQGLIKLHTADIDL